MTIDKLVKVHSNPPAVLKPWLSHEASLTAKLKTFSGDAKLEVLKQDWTLPSWWDKFTLGLSVDSVIHRDILMFTHRTPCWYARSIIPSDSYQANQPFFNRLTEESLGEIVFTEPSIQRSTLINYAINNQCIEYHWFPSSLADKNSQFWVRLSVFTSADIPSFYLVEILLPTFLRIMN